MEGEKRREVICMSVYLNSYSNVLKKNFMLVIIASILLVITFFIWAGVPIFIIGNAVAKITSQLIIIYLCVLLSAGFLFSLYFFPINLKVAKNVAEVKHSSVISSFIRIQCFWVLACSLIIGIIISIGNLI